MQNKIKTVVLFTPSHKDMFEDYLLPSIPKDDRIELKVIEHEQVAEDIPQFNSVGWKNMMHVKARVLYDELINIPENDVYFFVDCDVICVNNFVDYFLQECDGYDFIAQNDIGGGICSGVIVFRNTENCRAMLKATMMLLHEDKWKNEQELITELSINHRKYYELQTLKYKLLPTNKCWTYGINQKVWEGGDFNIPPIEEVITLHANWTEHKWKRPMLKILKNKVLQFNSEKP